MGIKFSCISRFFAIVLVAFMVLSPLTVDALVFGGGSISADDIAEDLEKRYHLNLDSIQSFGESFNVSEYKTSPPEVRLFFSPADPKPGYEVTVSAFPQFFSNDTESLYFTWYLKRDECDADKTVDSDKLYCDADDDGNVDIEDWKIEAMRKLVNNGFDTSSVDYSLGDSDDDDYQAVFGGDNGFKAEEISGEDPSQCYIHDWQSGINYELTQSNDIDFNCTEPACLSTTDIVCPGEFDASATADGGAGGDPDTGGGGGSSSVSISGETFNEYSVCVDTGLTPSCVSQNSTTQGIVSCDIGVPRCISNMTEYTCDNTTSDIACNGIGSSVSCTTTPLGDIENLCRHLFPLAEGTSKESFITGDGDFDEDEEEFWGTDPHDPDTANTQYGDEANVVGLGQDSFTWNYQQGDEIGVVVEGESLIPTKHDDRSSMIMWALPKNICPVINTGAYTENIQGYNVVIPTSQMDINECLESNLVDPREGGQPGNIDVSLSYYPDFPVNDPEENDPENGGSGSRGDQLVITSSADSSTNTSAHMVYDWNIQISSDGTYSPREYNENLVNEGTAGWVGIEQALQDADLVGHTTGNNLSDLIIDLNITPEVLASAGFDASDFDTVFANGAGYLKILLDISEYYDYDNTARKGHAEIVVKITSTESRIIPYKPTIDTGSYLVSIDGSSTMICEEEDEAIRQNVCFVTQNEIIGVALYDDTLDNFSWELNGLPLVCDENISSVNCDEDQQTNYNFFPVTGSVGDLYTVTVSASAIDGGEIVEFSRTFQIVEPYIELLPLSDPSASTETIFKKYLGRYIDETGTEFFDYSENVFQAYFGSVAGIEAVFHPGHAFYDSKMQWTVDAETLPIDMTNPDEYWFSVDKLPSELYNIGFEAIHYEDAVTRQALHELWNISAHQTKEQYLDETVTVEVVASREFEETAFAAPKALFASLITNAPSHILFSLQLFLVLVVTLGVVGFIFSLYPEPRK